MAELFIMEIRFHKQLFSKRVFFTIRLFDVSDFVSWHRGAPDPEPAASVVSDQPSHLAGRGHAAAGAARQEPALPRHRHRHHGAAKGLLRPGPVSGGCVDVHFRGTAAQLAT